ncbi:GNAT family N-acetyltransferase [Planctomycetes bacterium K23_9]|uniref:N-acetyltransferase domain-containing protein n=1 Tax=Stieleria marina TaxID=1930275 RepID=A0A517NUT3_9BACT|nr:hypothetical protein K239x_28540 [Planctomycetes bacterium K23_9]
MSDQLRFRSTEATDRDAIASVHRSAFSDNQGNEIAQLVDDLFADTTAQPIVSLVAEMDQAVVGHVLLTTVSIELNATDVSAMILSPVAVDASMQRRGIGSQLIRYGLGELQSLRVELVFVLGYPEYYGRFGFRPAGELGFQAPHVIPPQYADAWMVIELRQGAIAQNHGTIQCSRVLNQPQYWSA